MAHFAKLDENNVVTEIVVVHNNELIDENGNESEEKGIKFCVDHFGGNWIQTSYNGNFRGRYAVVGGTYDSTKNEFIDPPKPYVGEPLINKVEDDVQRQRWTLCVSCDKFDKSMSMCQECGCFMKIKTYLPDSECPIGKW